jgi:protein-tyrosine phosphatase
VDICQVNETGTLFVGSDIDDWDLIHDTGISVIVDMDGDLDQVPTKPDGFLYVYYPIYDEELPDLDKLHAVARLVAAMCAKERVLVHCRMGYNRSCLVVGLALTYMGWDGLRALAHLRAIRPAALYNEVFAGYLEQIQASS